METLVVSCRCLLNLHTGSLQTLPHPLLETDASGLESRISQVIELLEIICNSDIRISITVLGACGHALSFRNFQHYLRLAENILLEQVAA